MVSETAALRLGAAVARAAAGWWLGSRRREQERHLSMEELIRVRVPGVRLQREVRQQFEQITNAVFDRLEPRLGQAFARLEENGRQAVIDAVADTLARADLSDDALFDANARPAELVRALTDASKGPVGLNEAETRLYEALFAECVEYYVRIVRSLPVFEERAAAELLSRTAALGNKVAYILQRLPDRSLLAPEGSDLDTDFRRRYLELVSRRLDEVELFRRPSDHTTASRVPLSVAYVSLRTTGDGDARPRRDAERLRPHLRDWERGGGEHAGRRVEAALSDAPRVLLRGEAGSGKTTLLRWLAITAARGAFRDELADWNGLIPILVKLREYSGRRLPAPAALLDGVAAPISGLAPRAWVERQLAAGRVLLLVDGVDELVERERRAARDWLRGLRGLLDAYPDTRVVVTSRPAAAEAPWLRQEKFTALHLDRMTPADLAAFVRQWHQAVGELGDDLPCPAEELPQYERSLLASLRDRAHLQALAGTPLLAAMLCSMHLYRGRHLPRDRMELYRNALHTLVHDRDAVRDVPSAVDSRLSLDDKLVLLRDLAWRLSESNRSETDLERAATHVGAKLRAMRHLDEPDGVSVLRQLLDRSGVLRSPAEGRLDFVHRTFQEYLAAEEAAEEDRIGSLVGHAHLDQWRETIILAAGHANARQRAELLHGILDRADAEPRHARALRLLAASCQETVRLVDPDLGDRLDRAIARLLPPRRETDPPALAAVGPTLLRSLPRTLARLTEKAAIETVHTLALIGGEESLDRLAGYVDEKRTRVVRELIAAWDYFDADAYADRVLAHLPLAGHVVNLHHPDQIRAAARLRSVTGVRIRHSVRGLEGVADLPPLTRLWVGRITGAADLSVLRAHPQLDSLLLLGSYEARGTSVLEALTGLEWLGVSATGDLTPESLRPLSHLEHLELLDVPESFDLGGLTALPRLRHLALTGNGESVPRSFGELARLTALDSLELNAYDLRDWLAGPISAPPALSVLRLFGCLLPTDPSVFARFEHLRALHLIKCRTPDGPVRTYPGILGVDIRIY
ncbi:NACHT domain-containing protein [Streptomyces sp. 3MP-14]|uniref:NACHT domain-containing protein n=1 Tax=Streptomyces mimosae TaxID=2586635 RepID=A0A5N6AAP6_9ACTN|nr:NACHT domain-containing protein [Streptomyces mimosae]KAB8176286.1 NACHT domain-containing protein [Streptomyces sp. 3MP-14]